jgi:hypothetical protein
MLKFDTFADGMLGSLALNVLWVFKFLKNYGSFFDYVLRQILVHHITLEYYKIFANDFVTVGKLNQI